VLLSAEAFRLRLRLPELRDIARVASAATSTTFVANKLNTNSAIVWIVAPCSVIEVYRRFRGSYYLHHRPDDGGTSISEISENVYQTTRRNNPEDSHVHNLRRENLKYHELKYVGSIQ
jgi:hypothetical protein